MGASEAERSMKFVIYQSYIVDHFYSFYAKNMLQEKKQPFAALLFSFYVVHFYGALHANFMGHQSKHEPLKPKNPAVNTINIISSALKFRASKGPNYKTMKAGNGHYVSS